MCVYILHVCKQVDVYKHPPMHTFVSVYLCMYTDILYVFTLVGINLPDFMPHKAESTWVLGNADMRGFF